jgi:4-amino-4-deoxy-L-arabinose transferase-like glycosyltransferase
MPLRLDRHALNWLDYIAVALAFLFALAFIEGCQMNLEEAPLNSEGGSAYQDDAPCNMQWQIDHPRAAAWIQAIPIPRLGILALLLSMFTGMTLPYLVAIYLGWRVWAKRRQPRRWAIWLGCLVLFPVLPWIIKSLIVIGD